MRPSWRPIRLALTIAAATLSGGCVPASAERAVCGSLPGYTYSREQQTQAALELASLPHGSPTRQMVTDYGDWRARRRAVCP